MTGLFTATFAGVGGPPQASAWSPYKLPRFYQWYDAQNSSSLTISVLGSVVQWDGQQQQVASLAGTAVNGAVVNPTGINGFQSITVGANRGFTNDSSYGLSFLAGATGASVIVVAKILTRPLSFGAGNFFFQYAAGVGFPTYSRLSLYGYPGNLGGEYGANYEQIDGDYQQSSFSSPDGALPINTPVIMRLSMDYTAGIGELFLSNVSDTVPVNTNTHLVTPIGGATGAVSPAPSLWCDIAGGSHSVKNQSIVADIGEMIMVKSVLGSTDVTNLNAFLRSKWHIS